jgi:SRSO17 transposase
VAGLLGGTERKSVEPIALAQGVDRRQLQHFVGVSPWDHLPLLGRLQGEVAEDLGDPEGVLVADGSATPKKGNESVGVGRQW